MKTTVLYFSAKWCGPCKTMAPMIEELQKELPDILWEKIDIDERPEVAERHSVLSIPTFLVSHGEQRKRVVGASGKTTLSEALTKWE